MFNYETISHGFSDFGNSIPLCCFNEIWLAEDATQEQFLKTYDLGKGGS